LGARGREFGESLGGGSGAKHGSAVAILKGESDAKVPFGGEHVTREWFSFTEIMQ
jgi:hypothetical protein